ncbi:hypothetical protein BLOT_000924 [Blomia tropicalis]|nr:hypothetical protein BLOT_000924 [Blomia tropicalis]
MTYQSSCNSFDLFNDQNDLSETQFLKNSIVNHTKYGSTNHNAEPNYRYITHYIDTNDTLQGLALKYGCKIETIKKFNKLFSDDNNYLRSRLSLLIPIEIPLGNNSTNLDSDLSSPQSSSSSHDTIDIVRSSSINDNNINNKKLSTHQSLSFEQKPATAIKCSKPNKSTSLCDSSQFNSDNFKTPEESIADFLIRIDSSIAKTKNQVDKMSQKINDNSIENEFGKSSIRFNPPKLATTDGRVLTESPSSRSIFSFEHESNIPRVSSGNNRRKVKSSMKRMEKSHEEIFEL